MKGKRVNLAISDFINYVTCHHCHKKTPMQDTDPIIQCEHCHRTFQVFFSSPERKKLEMFALCSLVFLLMGCAPIYLRVTELDTSGQIVTFGTGRLGGCLVEMKGNPPDNIEITYAGERCQVHYVSPSPSEVVK